MTFSFVDKTDNRINEIAASLYSHSIREAVANLCKKKKITDVPKAKSINELIESFEGLGSTKSEKLIALYEAEAISPTRHIFLTYFDGVLDVSNCLTEKEFPDKVANYPLHFRYLDQRFENEGMVSAIYDHKWKYQFRQEVTKDNARKRIWEESTEIRRHSIVVHFNTKKKYICIAYSGFQKGGENYLTGGVVYESLCKTIVSIVEADFKITIKPVNLREVIKHISGRSTPKFSVNMIDSKYKELELFLRKGGGDKSIIEDLSEALASNLNIDNAVVFSAFQTVISQSKVEETELKWTDQNVKTMIRFLSIGPEIRFSWDTSSHEITPQLKICDLLTELSLFANGDNTKAFWNYLTSLADGSVVEPIQIQQVTGLDAENAKTSIVTATEMGLLVPVYKINSDKNFTDFNNTWKPTISELKKKVETIDGVVIDGGDLNNIIIGLKKTNAKMEKT